MASLILPQQTRLDVVAELIATSHVLDGCNVLAYKVNVNVTDQTALADVTGANECNFDGYSRQGPIVWGPDIYYNSLGVASVYGAMLNFQSAPDQTQPQSIFGFALVQAFTAPAAPVQSALTLVAGGTLTEPTEFFYVVTSFKDGVESVASNEENATTTSADKSITVTWASVAGVDGYKIYRGTVTGTENLLIATIEPGSTVTYTDTGASAGSPATPPASAPTQKLRGVMALDAATPIVNYPDGQPFLPRYDFAG